MRNIDLNAVEIHRCRYWSGSNSRSINVSREDVQFVPSCRERSAEAVDRKDWSPIADRRQIARNHMKDSHVQTPKKSMSRYQRDRAARAKNESDEPLIRYCADAWCPTRPRGIPGSQGDAPRGHARRLVA